MQRLILLGLLFGFIAVSTCASCPRLKTRGNWGAVSISDVMEYGSTLPDIVAIKETGVKCVNRGTCATAVKNVQYDDIHNNEYKDINCNFVIGSDGSVYEGTGWTKTTTSTNTMVICMLGQFDKKSPDSIQETTLSNFMQCPTTTSHLAKDYTVQAWQTLFPAINNPGQYLYPAIEKLPHFMAADKIDEPTIG